MGQGADGAAAELKRVQGLRQVFHKRAGEGRRKSWTARLVWAEADADAPHSIELIDLLILLRPDERDRFLDGLSVNSAGLGGETNVSADAAFLPRKRVPARLLLTIRISPES